MAQKRKASKKLDKKKKRKWYSIHAPKSFGNLELGESYISSPEKLIGKRIRANLNSLTRIKGSNIRIKFQIIEVKENKGLTEAISYEVLPNHINRIVRKNKSKIDTSLKSKTKNKIPIQIKAIIITRSKIKGGVYSALKKEAMELIEQEMKNNTFEKILDSIIKYDLQKSLKNSLKKITPIQTVEIKYFGK